MKGPTVHNLKSHFYNWKTKAPGSVYQTRKGVGEWEHVGPSMSYNSDFHTNLVWHNPSSLLWASVMKGCTRATSPVSSFNAWDAAPHRSPMLLSAFYPIPWYYLLKKKRKVVMYFFKPIKAWHVALLYKFFFLHSDEKESISWGKKWAWERDKKRNELAESLLCEIKGRKRLIQREEEGETAKRKKASFFSLKGSKRETKDPAATNFFLFNKKSKIKQGVSMIIYF